MDRFLGSIDPRFSIYTYKLLDLGVDCSTLFTLSDEVLKGDCGITNAVHRQKLLHSVQGKRPLQPFARRRMPCPSTLQVAKT